MYPVLFYPTQPYFILFYSILSNPTLFCSNIFYPIHVFFILFYPSLRYAILSQPTLFYSIPAYSISILSQPTLFYPIPANFILFYPSLLYSNLSHPTLFYSILTYPILLYPLIFYSILFSRIFPMFSIPQCSGANDTLTLPLLQTLLGIFTKMWSPSSLASAKPHLTIIPLFLDFRISPLLFFSLQILLPLIPSLLKQFFFPDKSFLFLKYTINLLSSSFRLHNSFLYQPSPLLLNPLLYSPTLYSTPQPSPLLPNQSTLQPSPLLSNPLLYSPTLSSTLQPSPLLFNPLLNSPTLYSTLQPYPYFEFS